MKTIETERLILRDWQIEYLDDLYEYAKNPDIGSIQGWEPHSSKEVSLNALKSYIEDDDRWAIILRDNGKVIGSVQLCPDENRGKYYAKYIHYVLSHKLTIDYSVFFMMIFVKHFLINPHNLLK